MGEEDDVNRKDIGKSASDSAQVIDNVTGLIAGVHFPQLCGQQIISNFPSSMVSGQQVRASPMRANTGASQPPLRNVVAVPMIRQPNNMQFLMNSREIASSTSLIPLHTPYVLQGNSYVTVPQGHAPMNLIQIQGHPYMIPGNQMSYVQAPSTTLIQSSLASARSVKRDNKDHEETRDKLEIVDDSQELPPALDRVADEEEVDENKETTIGFNILDAFRKEAEQFKKIVDERGIFVHNINGCVIEESADPFPADNNKSKGTWSDLRRLIDAQNNAPLWCSTISLKGEAESKKSKELDTSVFNDTSKIELVTKFSTRGRHSFTPAPIGLLNEKENDIQDDTLQYNSTESSSSSWDISQLREMSVEQILSTQKSFEQIDSQPNSSTNQPNEEKRRRSRRNELSQLLSMDFGPKSGERILSDSKRRSSQLSNLQSEHEESEQTSSPLKNDQTDVNPKNKIGTSECRQNFEEEKKDEDNDNLERPPEHLQNVHPYNWTVADTCQWVIKVTGSNDVANSLQIEDVDCLLLLSLSLKDLRDAPFNLKFGTARRIELALEKLCEEWKICNRFEEIDLPLTDKGPRLISVDDMYEMVYEATNDANIAARLRVEEINGEVLQHSTWDELRDLCITEIPLSFGTRKKMNRLEHFFNRLKARWSGLRRIC